MSTARGMLMAIVRAMATRATVITMVTLMRMRLQAFMRRRADVEVDVVANSASDGIGELYERVNVLRFSGRRLMMIFLCAQT